VEGKALDVDFCGDKSKKDSVTEKKKHPKDETPINPLELFVAGFPSDTTKEDVKLLFKNAVEVSFPKPAKSKNKRFCFVRFSNAQDTKASFEKNANIKIHGTPIDVLYARLKRERGEKVQEMPKKGKAVQGAAIATKSPAMNGAAKKQPQKPGVAKAAEAKGTKKPNKMDDEDDDDDELSDLSDVPSSNEGLVEREAVEGEPSDDDEDDDDDDEESE